MSRYGAAMSKWLAVALVVVVGCDSEARPKARIVVMSDTHVIGPQYTTPDENTPADNESIFLTPARLMTMRDTINAMDPAPEAVFVAGDVIHAAHHDLDLAWYDDNRNAYTVAKEIFDGFDMPVHVLMGNHDYETGCGDEPDDYPKQLSEDLFRHFFGAEPWYAVEVGGMKVYMLNGQQGRTWDASSPDCDDEVPSFGAAQLGWLDDELSDGKPAIVMSHYMGLLWDGGESPNIEDTLDAHANVKLYLGGHTHRWVDLSSFFEAPQYVLGPARYDADNFWVLELDPDAGEVTIVDRDKAVWYNSCASTYRYDTNPPTLVEGAVEDGTCVMGIE